MIFKGIKWRKTRKVFELPTDTTKENWNYIRFGRMCKDSDKGAIATNYTYTGNGQPVYAKEIPCDGHSLTNMMYGKDEVRDGEVFVRAYCKVDGRVYTARWYHKLKTQELWQKKRENRK